MTAFSSAPGSCRSRSRGMTLIEVMAASVVLIIAVLGAYGAQVTAANRIAGGGRDSEAAAMAQELAGFLSSLPYTATSTAGVALLSNTVTSNDVDPTDLAGAMNAPGVTMATLVDHSEADFPAALATGLTPINATNPNNTTTIYQRYWNVAPIADPISGVANAGVTIAAIVRYQIGGVYKHVAVLTTRFDPTLQRQ